MKPLTIYYSYGGNTEQIAKRIQQRTGGDLARIDTAISYTGDYNRKDDRRAGCGSPVVPAS